MTSRPRVDGLVTRAPGVALGILTADCAPVLFADPQAGLVAAAHAGWRGAIGGVLEATLAALAREGAERGRIAAAVGPCIGGRSYEVGPEFPAPFLAERAENAHFFASSPRAGHWLFDLGAYVEAKLRALGLASVERIPPTPAPMPRASIPTAAPASPASASSAISSPSSPWCPECVAR